MSWISRARFLTILLTALLSVGLARAQVPRDSKHYATYSAILQDLVHDLRELDTVSASPEKIAEFERRWSKFLADPTATNPLLDEGQPWSKLWPPKEVGKSKLDLAPEYQGIEAPTIDPAAPHSLTDVTLYASQRIGPMAAKLLHDKKIDVEIYAGSDASLGEMVAKQNRQLVRIPSLYEDWGIEKFLDLSPQNGKAALVIKVPPISEYAKHYTSMATALGATVRASTMNQSDRAALKKSFAEGIDQVWAQLPTKPEHVGFGYARHVQASLQDAQSSWNLVAPPTTYKSANGMVGAKLFQLRSKGNPSITTHLLALESHHTVWGEGARFLAEAAIAQPNVKSFYFMGSAGALSPTMSVYDVSVPTKFVTPTDSVVTVPNAAEEHLSPAARTDRAVHKDAIHGNSFSPVEQTVAYVKKMKAQKIGSIDVEQSLIAQAIGEHNARSDRPVQFYAANVITDAPGKPHVAGAADLTRTDITAKTNAQRKAVGLILNSIEARGKWETNADNLRTEKIKQALGTEAERIHVSNGVGKVDADPKRKLSYFVYTERPSDARSPTYLIPMATSRFDALNYNTDEWWDAHKAEIDAAKAQKIPPPKQDPAEVKKWLIDNNLSTNPDVYEIHADATPTKTIKLKDYLLQDYLRRYTRNGKVVIYRGGERPGELADWKARRHPKGARYYTPEATYAWRYGRKSSTFANEIAAGEAPVFKFEIPVEDFKHLVKTEQLVLGTELTKKTHDTFASNGKFLDHLANNTDYLGDGQHGLELEIRAKGGARELLPRWFTGAVSADELIAEREKQIRTGYMRLKRQQPQRTTALDQSLAKRLRTLELEKDLFNEIKSGTKANVTRAVAELKAHGQTEVLNIDGLSVETWAMEAFKKYSQTCEGPVGELLGL
ncbi:MAG: hypothetical protein JST16_09710 [Bdellovibrionales bacterium]|nr:hypothetical protein [Bdellovibrionales bacterium]